MDLFFNQYCFVGRISDVNGLGLGPNSHLAFAMHLASIKLFSKLRKLTNWHIVTDTLFAIIKAQGQISLRGFKYCITRNICDMPKLKKYIHIFIC